MRWLIYLVLFVMSFAASMARAAPLVLTAQTTKLELSEQLTYLRDPGGRLTLDDVASLAHQNAFVKGEGILNFGITSDVIWLQVVVQRDPSAAEEWWLELAPAYIEEATLYQLQGNGELARTPGSVAGIASPLSTRDFKARHSTFRIYLNDSKPKVFFIKLRSATQLNARLYLWQPAFYAERSAREHLTLGIYYGVFSLILSICAVRWWTKRNRAYFWWLIYLVAEGLLIFRMNGLASHYLFPEFPMFNAAVGSMALSLMVVAGSNFGIHAFAIEKTKYPYSYHAAKGIAWLAMIFGVIRVISLGPASTIFLLFLSFLLCLLNCAFSYRFLKSGEASAKFYFVAIWFMTASVIPVLARNFGIIPAYQFLDYVWQSNMIVHAGLVSFGMVLDQRETANERNRSKIYQDSAELNQKYSNLQKRMVTLVSHEFRNSLALLNVSMHVISKRRDLPSEVIERHRNIVRIHHQMRKVIDNFLLEERIQNAAMKVLYERTEMHSLIHDVIGLAELCGKGQPVLVDLHGFPEYLWLDEGILRLVLTNLLDNASKYSEAGSEIKLIGHYGDGLLRMKVSDNGIGMTEESLAHLFEPHFKADLKSEGIGIGLYMVRLMLQAHGGDMCVKSTLSGGSTLEFWLRVRVAREILMNQAAGRQISH